MTDTLLALVPTYGVWLILVSLLLSCLALPVPSSILVMTAGGFAATEDLELWQVQLAAFAGFVAGDQLAYAVAAGGGSRLIARLRQRERLAALFDRAEALIHRHGSLAVFLSRTLVSPLGPYVGYLAGALRLRWVSFTLSAIAGAVCWSVAYSLLGYYFATRIARIASLIGNSVGVVIALVGTVALGWYLFQRWKAESADQTGPA